MKSIRGFFIFLIVNFFISTNIFGDEIKEGVLRTPDERFENLKKIQNVFLNCHFNNPRTNNLFEELISNKNTDFSRYNYFHASFLANTGKVDEAKNIINSALKSNPRNLLLNQYKLDLNQSINYSIFNCKNIKHVIAEILYITSNALSSQSIYPLSVRERT